MMLLAGSSSETAINVSFDVICCCFCLTAGPRDFHRLIDASAPKSDMGGDAGKQGPAPNCDLY
jgi:hypothetical protein